MPAMLMEVHNQVLGYSSSHAAARHANENISTTRCLYHMRR